MINSPFGSEGLMPVDAGRYQRFISVSILTSFLKPMMQEEPSDL